VWLLCHHRAVLVLDGGFGLVLFVLWVFCVIDVITTDAALCRNLPKPVWVLIVLLLFDVGALLWLVAGRAWHADAGSALPYKGNTGRATLQYPEYDRRGRFAATNPEDDDAFLAQVRARAAAQRQTYLDKRRAELQREQDDLLRRPDDDRSTD
jgi:hypothetical protein